MKTADEIYVAFHIGRGGRSYNAGYVTYLGEMNINKLIEYNNMHLFYQNKDKKGRFCQPFYSDLNGNPIITEKQAKTNVGVLDFDGQYDTDVCERLSECTHEQLQLINNDSSYKSIDLVTELERLLLTE
jgi:hypothetical protein